MEDLGASYLHTLSATYNEIRNVILNGGGIYVQHEITDGGYVQYKRESTFNEGGFSALHEIVDAEEAGSPVGYYFGDVFSMSDNSFYSATPDGEMSYTQNK